MINQAYDRWVAFLDKTLYEIPSKANRPEALRDKNTELKKTIEEKNKELAASAMQLHSKDEFILELKKTIDELTQSNDGSESQKKTLNKMVSKIEEKMSGNKDWETFEDQFDLLHSDFFKKLKSDFPKLSV